MLTKNLWIQANLVNGSLGLVTTIMYNACCKLPDLPNYVVFNLHYYIGPPWDPQNPRYIPILAITQGNETPIQLTMAWEITIHKA